jgi:nucleotide-binding universal stress UspA family protein
MSNRARSRDAAPGAAAGGRAADELTPIRRILVATDCSPCADAAAAVALRLARPLKAALDVLIVVDTSGWTDVSGHPAYRRQRAAEVCAEARQRASAFAERHFAAPTAVAVHVRDSEEIAGEIVRAAAALHSDLIVMGTHATTGLTHLILGSVAERVVRSSPIPVLTVRGPT